MTQYLKIIFKFQDFFKAYLCLAYNLTIQINFIRMNRNHHLYLLWQAHSHLLLMHDKFQTYKMRIKEIE